MLPRVLAVLAVLAQMTFISAEPRTPSIYFVRHGEEADDNAVGLSPRGEQRAECIANLFDATSKYGIGHIIVPLPLGAGIHQRSYDTATPLAQRLGLLADYHCDRDDYKCTAGTIQAYNGTGNILMIWQHDAFLGVAKELGYTNAIDFPHGVFDKIYKFPGHKDGKFRFERECCPGLDERLYKCADMGRNAAKMITQELK